MTNQDDFQATTEDGQSFYQYQFTVIDYIDHERTVTPDPQNYTDFIVGVWGKFDKATIKSSHTCLIQRLKMCIHTDVLLVVFFKYISFKDTQNNEAAHGTRIHTHPLV